MQAFKNFFQNLRCTRVESVSDRECYDELLNNQPVRVGVKYGPNVCWVTATTDSDLHDVMRYFTESVDHDLTAYRQVNVPLRFTWTLRIREKLISDRGIPLRQYNIHENDIVVATVHSGFGGASDVGQLAATQARAIMASDVKVQSWNEIPMSFFNHTKIRTSVLINQLTSDDNINFIAKLVEDVTILMYQVVHSKSKQEALVAAVAFLKMRSGKTLWQSIDLSIISNAIEDIFDMVVQSTDNVFENARDFMGKFDKLRESTLFKKIYKFLMYALSLSLFEWAGLTFDKLNYPILEREAIKRKYHMGVDFVHCILDTTLFVCERGYQCMKSGSLDPIYHSGDSYSKWYDDAMKIKRDSLLMSDPTAHGLNKFQFLKDVNSALEKGYSVQKYTAKLSPYEKMAIKTLVNELEMIKANELSKRAAQKSRRAPFPVLLSGGSSVGKSTLVDLIFYQYGKTFNLPTESEFKYTRNFSDDFWSGFDPSMWFVNLDDVAFMDPNVASNGGDPSLTEVLRIFNRIPLVTNQAELADKGKCPFRAKCVVATTNTENLNAYAYFSCPLAIQRRLPYVVDVKPKTQFTKLGQMLDSTLTPPPIDGEIPDLWTFEIKLVKPIESSEGGVSKLAKLDTILTFDNIHDFLAWISITAIEFEENEKRMEMADQQVRSIDMCTKCFRAKYVCSCVIVQATDVEGETERVTLPIYGLPEYTEENRIRFSREAFAQIFDRVIMATWTFCYFVYLDRFIFRFCYVHGPIRRWIIRYMREHLLETRLMRNIVRKTGERIKYRWFNVRKFDNIAAILTIALGVTGFVIAMKRVAKNITPEVQGQNQSKPDETASRGRAPVAHDGERVNAWFKDDYQTTTFDISPMTSSYARFSIDELSNILARNCVHFNSRYWKDGEIVTRPNKAICLGGHRYLVNNHGIPQSGDIELEIIQDLCTTGVSTTIKLKVTQSEIYRFPDRDVALIDIYSLPPKKDITELFAKETLRGKFNATYLSRQRDGSMLKRKIAATSLVNFNVTELKYSGDLWMGTVSDNTSNGDCGSLMLGVTPQGPVILGFHVIGSPMTKLVGSMPLTYEQVNFWVKYNSDIVVQSGVPELSSLNDKREVEELHHKSTMRYMEHGVANVYGSFRGFRMAPKSRVVPTVLAERLKSEGYETKCGPPVMSGYQPWRIAALDMVNPVTKLNVSVLKECAQSYLDDIVSGLPIGWKDDVHVYDEFTAMNGAAGVAYVDKINRNTSAGNPWKRCKKYFLHPVPAREGLMDPVMASNEIMDRVHTIIETYESGQRSMTNFCAHLKDEATKWAKILAGKTRVFTGGPFDWTIVVRMYYLCMVRLIQNNRFVFESAVGTNAHSIEWAEMYHYLTRNGERKIIAGDYAAFDKSMPPAIILQAFWILRQLCFQSGNYAESDLRVLAGIAEDVAFPLVDFNGDLIEFYGSNPSGHPLTVIINGLANSLYMRYCYAQLHPDKHCRDFKENVDLMTYGDDNIMGVSDKAPWFNHTSIQQILSDVGITYTMADKESKSVPYIDIKEANFLKRSWRFDEDVGNFVCQLEHSSIEKSLVIGVKSKTVSPEAQAVDIISSALREYFWYGREVFACKTRMFQEVVEDLELTPWVQESTFPSWSDLYDSYWAGKKKIPFTEDVEEEVL